MEWGRGGKKKIMPILGSLDSSASPESENRGEEKKREEETGGEKKKKNERFVRIIVRKNFARKETIA